MSESNTFIVPEPRPLPEPPKRRKRVGLIVGASAVGVIALAGIVGANGGHASSTAAPVTDNQVQTTPNAEPTATPTTAVITDSQSLADAMRQQGLTVEACEDGSKALPSLGADDVLLCNGAEGASLALATFGDPDGARTSATMSSSEDVRSPTIYGDSDGTGWMIIDVGAALPSVTLQGTADVLDGTLLGEEYSGISDEPSKPSLTTEQEQAVDKAQSYLDNVGGFSRKGLIKQLKYEGFSTNQATFATDYIKPNFKKQAAIKAHSYLDTVGGFSKASLRRQLAYEGFTNAQTTYAISQVF